jgi:hypothetical protein
MPFERTQYIGITIVRNSWKREIELVGTKFKKKTKSRLEPALRSNLTLQAILD